MIRFVERVADALSPLLRDLGEQAAKLALSPLGGALVQAVGMWWGE